MKTSNDDGGAPPTGPRTGYRGAPGEQVVSDPVRIRALTHPLRLALLDVLDGAGQATATECAAATGESVASCSYHLRILAKHGYIEPGEQAGRDKPWKPVAHSRAQSIDHNLPGSRHAVVALAGMESHKRGHHDIAEPFTVADAVKWIVQFREPVEPVAEWRSVYAQGIEAFKSRI